MGKKSKKAKKAKKAKVVSVSYSSLEHEVVPKKAERSEFIYLMDEPVEFGLSVDWEPKSEGKNFGIIRFAEERSALINRTDSSRTVVDKATVNLSDLAYQAEELNDELFDEDGYIVEGWKVAFVKGSQILSK